MSAEIRVPQLGESIVEATVGRWLKNEGDDVSVGDPVVELETEKVNMEVPAPDGGVLRSIVKPEGETVGIGDVLGIIDGSQAAGDGSSASQPTSAQPAAAQPAAEQPPSRPDEGNGATPVAEAIESPAQEPRESSEPERATPLARRFAAEQGIDLSRVPGTGPAGRVTREDVTSYLANQRTPAAAPPGPALAPPAAPPSPAPSAPVTTPVSTADGRPEERVRMSRRRLTIARRLVEAQQTAAILTTFNEIDMSAVIDVRKRRRDAFKERHGIGLGFMSFFTKAVVGALKAYPRLNAEIQGNEMVLKHYYDIGIAVGAEEGLVVPVVRDADRLTFAEVEQQIATLAEKARNKTLSLAELEGGTFTISNGGIYGSLLSTPILNTPQVGVLGMHKIEERPIALNGEVVIRPMMYVALSYDHRIVDGNEAVRFLVRIKELVEDPETLLLEG